MPDIESQFPSQKLFRVRDNVRKVNIRAGFRYTDKAYTLLHVNTVDVNKTLSALHSQTHHYIHCHEFGTPLIFK